MLSDPATVLIAEDNEYNRDMLSRWLARLGHRVITAADGRQALEKLELQACDVFLLDIMMPEMNGYEVLEKLRADGRLHHLPVIVISSVDDLNSVAKCIELGAEDYLFKPFDRVLLKARLDASLEKKHLREKETVYQQQMLAAQKLASLGTLAAGVAHEMNSPLQVVIGTSETLLRAVDQGAPDPERLRGAFEIIQRNARRCAQISTALRTYAQAAPSQTAPNDVNALVEDAVLLVETYLRNSTSAPLSIETKLKPDLPPLECDRNQIIQALISLLTNARDAMPDGGQITLHTDYDPELRQFQLQVKDTGAGIPEAIQGRIFDPFFTTKPIGQGMGLGLSTLAGIIKAHGGKVEVHSALGQGTVFTLLLPDKLPTSDQFSWHTTGGRFDDSFSQPAAPK